MGLATSDYVRLHVKSSTIYVDDIISSCAREAGVLALVVRDGYLLRSA